MKKYILNSAVITSPGTYQYELISAEEARQWYGDGDDVISTIGYQETAEALSAILGKPVTVNRRMVKLERGDEALVFRLTIRLADPSIKGQINDPTWLLEHSEIGVLRHL